MCTMVNQKAQGLSRGSARFLNSEETGARSVPRRTALAGGEQISRGTTTVPAVCLRIAPELLVGGAAEGGGEGSKFSRSAEQRQYCFSSGLQPKCSPFARSEEPFGGLPTERAQRPTRAQLHGRDWKAQGLSAATTSLTARQQSHSAAVIISPLDSSSGAGDGKGALTPLSWDKRRNAITNSCSCVLVTLL